MNSYVIRIGGRKSSGLLPAEITGGPGIKGRDLSMSDIPWWEELSQGTRPGSDKVRAHSCKSQPAASLSDTGQAPLPLSASVTL